MPNKTSLVVKKHSALIQTNVKDLTITQRKVMNYLIYILQNEEDSRYYFTSIGELRRLCGIKETNYKEIKRQLEKIPKVTIEFNYLDKDKKNQWVIMTVVPWLKVNFGTGIVKYRIIDELKEQIRNPRIYSPIDIFMIGTLNSKYSIILYEFLRDYLTAPKIPLLTIEDFRELMGVKEGKYKLFSNLRKKVIEVATKEILQKTDIICSYELIAKYGNKYSHIQFEAKKNENYKQKLIGQKSEKNLEEEIPQSIPETNIDKKIKSVLKYEHRTVNVFKIIDNFISKGLDYIISNIEYIYQLPEQPGNFAGYLKNVLKNDYAEELRLKKEYEAEEKRKIEKRNIKLMEKLLAKIEEEKSNLRPKLSFGGKRLTHEDMAIANLKYALEREAADKKIDLETFIKEKIKNSK